MEREALEYLVRQLKGHILTGTKVLELSTVQRTSQVQPFFVAAYFHCGTEEQLTLGG